METIRLFRRLRFLARIISAPALCIALLLSVELTLHSQPPASPQEPQDIGGLLLQSPIPLEDKGRSGPPAPDSPIVSMLNFGGKAGEFEITASVVDMKPGVPLSLTGAAEGSAKGVGAMPGVTLPRYIISNHTISGIPAKAVSLIAMQEGKEIGVESIFLIRGQQIIAVVVNFPGGDLGQRAKALEILASARLK